jgi:hypothetical protein
MILGSSGNEPPPSEADADVFFAKEWRWLETADKNWGHMTPIQGNWTISSIDLPPSVLRKIYFDNAQKLLARSIPPPALQARRITRDFEPDGDLSKELWQTAQPVRMEYEAADNSARPALATVVRMLWSQRFLYIAYECPFTALTTFESANAPRKRIGANKDGGNLWDRDVVEAFIGNDAAATGHYAEFEVAPDNERLDVMVRLPDKDLDWDSHFQSAVRIDQSAKVWTCEVRIPVEALGGAPRVGTKWRLNLYRCDRANQASLAWRPTLSDTFHVPDRFGTLEFVE